GAAETDDADPVAVAKPRRGERRRPPHHLFEGARTRGSRMGESVEEEDDVDVALGMALIDPEIATAGGGPPVHVPDPIPGDVGTNVGELDALPLLRGQPGSPGEV